MKPKEYRAICRYNELKDAYPGVLSTDYVLLLVYDVTQREFKKELTALRRKWKSENEPKTVRKRKKGAKE